MNERITTLHPEGKEGVNIERAKYDQVKDAIVKTLSGVEGIGFKRLRDEVQKQLENSFEGSISWYYTTIKLDLESRGIIERIPNQRPQMLRLRQK